jgi:histidinol phosphatase-like PHP family hydrolase
MMRPVYNLHNHTPFSDGAYSIDELCEAHLGLGTPIAGIGISDHLFCTPSSREVKTDRDFERVFGSEKRGYVELVREARQRWTGKLDILCGAEVNWPLNKSVLPAIVGMLDGIDYLLFEFVDWAGLTTLANQSRRFPCPVGLAHTYVPTQFPNTSMDQVVRTLANARIFYEINSKFLPLSPNDPWFKALPNHRVRVTLGTDTHDDLECLATLPTLADYAEQMGLGEKILVPSVRDEAPVNT